MGVIRFVANTETVFPCSSCFLGLHDVALTFFIPVGLIFIVICILFLRICCVLRGPRWHHLRDGNDPETEEVPVGDLDATGDDIASGSLSAMVTSGVRPRDPMVTSTMGTSMTASSTMDLEYRPVTQLRGVAMVLFLYLVTWASAAFSIALPFGDAMPHQAIIFSCLYAFSCVALGLFLLVFFSLGRHDGRESWRNCSSCRKDPHAATGASSIEVPISTLSCSQPQYTHTNGHLHSASSLSSVNTNRSSSFHPTLYGLKKPSNINLLPSHTASIITDNSINSGTVQDIPIFYNPRQNGIAKKYWQKSRQQRYISQLNKELNADSGHSSHNEGAGDRAKRRSYHGNSSDGGGSNHRVPRQSSQSPTSAEQLQNIYNSIAQKQLQQHGQYRAVGQVDPALYQLSSGPQRLPGPPHPHPHPHPQPLYPVVSAAQLARGYSPVTSLGGFTPVTSLGGYTPVTSLGVTSGEGSNFIPGESLPPSVTSSQRPLGPVIPPYLQGGYGVVPEYMQRNGSVPRLRDFDGQSWVSQEAGKSGVRSVTDTELPCKDCERDSSNQLDSNANAPVHSNPQPSGPCVTSSGNTEVAMATDQGTEAGISEPADDNCYHNNCNDSDTFNQNVKLPAPSNVANSVSGVEPAPNTHSTVTLTTKASSHTNLDPGSRRSSSSSSSRRRTDDSQPRGVSYVYVDHSYTDKVRQKLLKQAHRSGDSGAACEEVLGMLPRSVSGYEHATATEGESLMEESGSSTSDEEEEGDIWLPQHSRKRHSLKKETSV